MALKLGELTVDIGADTSDLKKAGKEVDRTAGSMEKSFKRVGSAIVAALSFQAIKSTVLLADSMNMLDARIKNVTKSAKDFAIVRKGIRDIAKETGNSIQSIATLSQNLLISAESIGATSEQVVQMTSNLNKLGSLGGSSAEQMSNAMLQFGQSMAGGIVRAEEFNSIVENTPLIAQSIAKGMGMTVGELRKAVIDGKVLSEDVFKALEGQTDSINKKFADMPLTIQRSSGMIATAFAVAVQEIDNGLEVTESIAVMMKDLSEVIESDLVPGIDTMVLGIKEFLMQFEAVTSESKNAVNETFNWAESLKLVKDGISFIFNAIKNLPSNLRAVSTIIIGEVAQAFIKLSSIAQKSWEFVATDFKNAMTRVIGTVKSLFFDFVGEAQGAFSKLFDFFGADKVAEAFQSASNESARISEEITTKQSEEVEKRLADYQLEVDAINSITEIKLEASQLAIDASLAETEATKKQIKDRIKALKDEMKTRREASSGISKDGKKAVDEDKKNKDAINFNLSDAQKTASALESAGLVDSENAARAQIGISAATAIAKTSELGFPAAIPFIAQALATIATAKKALSGAGRQAGGNVSQNVMHPVNENGQPELLVQGSKQFLLSGQSGGQIIPATSMRAGGSGGGMNVTVNNNASDLVDVSEPFVTQGELVIAIERASNQAVERVNTSLASGRGEAANSLQSGFSVTRNI